MSTHNTCTFGIPFIHLTFLESLSGGSDNKESVCSAGDLGLIPASGRSPGEGNGNPLQYSYLENSMDRGAWWATVHGVAKIQTQLSDYYYYYLLTLTILLPGHVIFLLKNHYWKNFYSGSHRVIHKLFDLLLLLSHFSGVRLCATP